MSQKAHRVYCHKTTNDRVGILRSVAEPAGSEAKCRHRKPLFPNNGGCVGMTIAKRAGEMRHFL